MIANLYIDGHDVYTEFGIFLTEGSYKGLMSFPSLKEPDKNDWAEQDGIDVDLSEPRIDTKEFQLLFGCLSTGNIGAFTDFISDGAFHSFNFIELGITKSLRLVSSGKYEGTLFVLRNFEFTFSDDFPLNGYTYSAPTTSHISNLGYRLDGKEFSDYGIAILDGSEAEILKPTAVKRNQLVSLRGQNGVTYDGQHVFFQAKDVTLKCCMITDGIEEYKKNWNALLYDLTKPNHRGLYFWKTDTTYPCYYKNSTIEELSVNGKVWCKFNLTLCFTSFRLGDELYIMVFDQTFDESFE
jgi:hypothetical protein